VKLDYDWDRDGAARELEQALNLNPGSGWAHHWNAHALEAHGRYDDALREFQAANKLDPLSIPIYWDICTELIAGGRYDEALQHLSKALDLYPNLPVFLMDKAIAFYSRGDVAQGHAMVEALQSQGTQTTSDPMMMTFIATVAVREGRPADGIRFIDQFEELRRKQYIDPGLVLPITIALKDSKRHELWAARLQEERSTLFLYVPLFDRFWRGMADTGRN
jgi:tetratricopeptide (TPR) repeat protein